MATTGPTGATCSEGRLSTASPIDSSGARDPEGGGATTIRVTGALGTGSRCRVDAGGHRLLVDELAELGGTDSGPNPIEMLLGALGASQAIGYRRWADILGIRLDGVTFMTEAEIDPAGMVARRGEVRAAPTGIRHRVVLRSPDPPDRLLRLAEIVDRHCPVLEVLTRGLPVKRVVELPGATA